MILKMLLKLPRAVCTEPCILLNTASLAVSRTEPWWLITISDAVRRI